MKRALRPYQRVAFRWTRHCGDHPALFLEMRLGKTLLTIRRISTYSPRADCLKVLVVAPASALYGWERELKLEGETDVVYLTGKRADRLALLSEGYRWNLINKEGHLALPEIADVRWDVVVLDESTFIKNPKSKVSKFFTRNFRDVPHRWILTGTPNPESEMDFFQQFLFLDGGQTFRARSFWEFRFRHYRKYGFEWVPRPGTKDKIHRLVAERSYILWRKQVRLDRPKVYETRYLELPKKLRRTYETAEEAFILEYGGEELDRTVYAMTKYGWLRQLVGGFIDKKLVWKGKFQELLSLLKGELAHQQVIVWAHFIHEIRYGVEYLAKHGIRDVGFVMGATPVKTRYTLFQAFDEGKVQVLFVQPNCAKFGVDFSAASAFIYYSNPLGYEARVQSEDRIIKVGDKSPVLYIDLLVKDAVDEDIYFLLQKKEGRSKGFLQLCEAIQRRHDDGR